MSRFSKILSVLVALAINACASLPNGPNVMVLPGTGMSFEQFRNDDALCGQYAFYQVGGTTSNQAAVTSEITSAAVGTALGAAAGVAFGGGRGAAIGAGTGLVGGSLVGVDAARGSSDEVQQRYDVAYVQCMYAKGHQVPVSGRFSDVIPHTTVAPDPHIPPPPPGPPPPPPNITP